MTSDPRGVNRDLTATQHFLFSKTPTEGTHSPSRGPQTPNLPSSAGDPLRQSYPGLRCGKAYMAWAAEKAAAKPLFTALALRDEMLPGTINLENPDPACDLDYTPNQAREARVDVAMSNSFGFGGHNASLVLARLD